RKVDPGPAAKPKPFHHVRPTKSDTQLKAGHAGLSCLQHRRADPELLSDVDRVLHKAFSCQILPERSIREIHFGQLLAPELVMLLRVRIHSLIGAAVHSEV